MQELAGVDLHLADIAVGGAVDLPEAGPGEPGPPVLGKADHARLAGRLRAPGRSTVPRARVESGDAPHPVLSDGRALDDADDGRAAHHLEGDVRVFGVGPE